jgi:hypothetical protein
MSVALDTLPKIIRLVCLILNLQRFTPKVCYHG